YPVPCEGVVSTAPQLTSASICPATATDRKPLNTHAHKLPLALTHTLVSLCVLMLQQLFRSDDLFPPLTQVTMQGPRDSLSLCLSHTSHTPHTLHHTQT